MYRRVILRHGPSDCEDPHKQEYHHLGHVGQHVSRAPDGGARALADVLNNDQSLLYLITTRKR